ncbi:UDP-N-acetylglucosamine 2-epimerase (non-hydrolyzing) [Amylibacter sp.]|nr:UDP-N-acetylglucosamine 2-epimerase (non-hydrolyzing) [Amylibacter sp.]
MNKMKVVTVVGTRPEIIRLSRVIPQLDNYCEHILVHTGQNYDYELNEIFFKDMFIRKPDYFLDAAGQNGTETIGKIIIEVDRILNLIQPDALLVLGDTNSCMAIISAKRRKIPTFHMEAGNRCFDMRVPEEINRRIVDHTADINLTYSDIARDYLINEGLPPDQIIKTGSPMGEVLNYYKEGINSSNILNILNLKDNEFFVISAHREENIESDKNFYKLVDILNTLAEHYKIPVIVSTHPRTQKRMDKLSVSFHENVRLLKPLGFKDYNKLQISSKAVLSDSGTINEESSILNFPALNIREAHERPEGMEEAAVMMVGLELDRVFQGLEILKNQCKGEYRNLQIVKDYNMPNVSDKIVRIIHSYVDYTMRTIWRQY